MKNSDEQIIRQKINELEEKSDDESVDTDALWLKLNTLRTGSNVKKISGVYYWAAAVLLLAVLFAALQPHKPGEERSGVLAQKKEDSMPSIVKESAPAIQKQLQQDIPAAIHEKPAIPPNQVIAVTKRTRHEDEEILYDIEDPATMGLNIMPEATLGYYDANTNDNLLSY